MVEATEEDGGLVDDDGEVQAGPERSRRFPFDRSLLTALVDRWRPETHTFHLPFGEMAPTLQDVAMLLGLPIVGGPAFPSDALLTGATPCWAGFRGFLRRRPSLRTLTSQSDSSMACPCGGFRSSGYVYYLFSMFSDALRPSHMTGLLIICLCIGRADGPAAHRRPGVTAPRGIPAMVLQLGTVYQ